jgi:penicillin-binding protein-related factor A (putative recombinase)
MNRASNAANDGRSFEKSLEIICRIYEEKGRATFSKVEPPCRTLGYGPGRRVIFLPNPFLDYTGCINEMNGRSAHFEAKSTSEPTLPCGDRGGFSQSQREAMERWRDAGAATWLLWEHQNEVRFWTFDMIQTGLSERRSLVWHDGLPVPLGTGFVFWDFMATVRQYEKYL